jgi:hypothetical protein
VRAANIFNSQEGGRSKRGSSLLSPDDITWPIAKALAPDGAGDSTLDEIAHDSLHHMNQEQIMGVASYVSPVSPPPFAAQFAEVTVDIETGQVTVDRLVMAVDRVSSSIPLTASGQVEGGMTQALGYAVCEEMVYDEPGRRVNATCVDYHIFQATRNARTGRRFLSKPSNPLIHLGEGGGGDPHGRGCACGWQCRIGCVRRTGRSALQERVPATRQEKIWRALKQENKTIGEAQWHHRPMLSDTSTQIPIQSPQRWAMPGCCTNETALRP